MRVCVAGDYPPDGPCIVLSIIHQKDQHPDDEYYLVRTPRGDIMEVESIELVDIDAWSKRFSEHAN